MDLNRALLARQHLLERVDLPIERMVEHLVGLQAQATPPPYYGLWSRLRDFDPQRLGTLLERGDLLRMTLMRATVHMVTPRDAAFLRPLVQPAIERNHRGAFGRRMHGLEIEVDAVRELLADGPKGARELARGLGAQDEEAGANAVRAYAPLYQVPPRGILGKGGQARYALLEDLAETRDPAELVRRYLAAFGPATVKDCQRWCGLTRLKDAFAALELVEVDTGLFDLPDAPRPDRVPAPVRFLGEYDNVLLGHADRSRIIPPDFPWGAMLAHGRFVNNLLVDGMLKATWWLEGDVLAVRPFGEIPYAQVEAEAARFPWARDIRFEPALPSTS